MPEREEWYCYLRNQTPRQDLSSFLMTRGFCWQGNGHYSKALKCFGWASTLDMDHNGPYWFIVDALAKWGEDLRSRLVKGLPTIDLILPKRVWPILPWEMEREIVQNAVREDLLRDYNFKKLVDRVKKSGKLPEWAPKLIKVTYPDRLMFDL